MPSLAPVSSRRRLVRSGLPALVASLSISAGASAALGQGVQAPAAQYFGILPAFNDGAYYNALASFTTMQQGAIKNPVTGNWIDSICYFTMEGECYYNLGQHAAALACYESALNLYLGYSTWMLQVMFPPVVPGVSTPASVAPWHTRPVPCGAFSATYNIQVGQINNNLQIIRGGVVTPAALVPVYASEIVRCTCLAIRRRTELMGPTCPYDPLTNRVLTALAQRPAMPNHWSMAWVEAPLGLAYAAAGKPDQAQRVLEQAVLAGGTVDHPLTPTVLLELGKLALAKGDLPLAQRYFLDASAVGVTFDNNIIEEALRYSALTHMLTNNGQSIYAPLPPAVTWANAADSVMHQLLVSLLVMTAEHQCVLRQPLLAQASLKTALVQMAHTDLAISRLGMRYYYVQALAAYQEGNVAAGDVANAVALKFQQNGGSLWLFQMGLVDGLWLSDGVSPRQAMDLFKFVLRDPTPMDWNMDPLESLASLVVPHPLFYEHWFLTALRQKQHETALEIADLLRRHRFLTSLELGGRLLNLRWLMEGPEEMLDQRAVNQRNDLRARYPQYEQFSRRARLLRAELRSQPLVTDDKEKQVEMSKKFEELAAVSLQQEKVLREISLRREPVAMVFPPLRSTKRVQESLPQGSALLAYIYLYTNRELHGFLIGKSKYDQWSVNRSRTKQFNRNLVGMLQKWGNFEANKDLTLEDLESDAWKKPAAELLKELSKEGRIDLAGQFDELIIVPDDVLWYIPFEALQFSDGDGDTKPLISKLRIRYAPTVGLSLADPRPQHQVRKTAVVVGKMFPRDEESVGLEAFDELSRVVPEAEAISGKLLPAPSAVYASLFDELVVLNELPPADGPYDWAPLYLDRGKFGSALGQWLSLPWGGPEKVVLPGYRTSAERAFKNTPGNTAHGELFLSICGLMATGARTVLISRWRTGGETSYDLTREFVQELPDMAPDEAWQRAVQIVRDQQLNPNKEPRLKLKGKDEPPKADDPFFWAGYLLVDTGGATNIAPDEPPPAPNVLAIKPVAGMPAAPNGAAGPANKPAGKDRRRNAHQPPNGNQDMPDDKSPFDEAPGAQGKAAQGRAAQDNDPADASMDDAGAGRAKGGSAKKRPKSERKKSPQRVKKPRPTKPPADDPDAPF